MCGAMNRNIRVRSVCGWMFLSCRGEELCLCQCFLCLSTGTDVWASTLASQPGAEKLLFQKPGHTFQRTHPLTAAGTSPAAGYSMFPRDSGASRLAQTEIPEIHEMFIHTFMLPQTVTPNDVGE